MAFLHIEHQTASRRYVHRPLSVSESDGTHITHRPYQANDSRSSTISRPRLQARRIIQSHLTRLHALKTATLEHAESSQHAGIQAATPAATRTHQEMRLYSQSQPTSGQAFNATPRFFHATPRHPLTLTARLLEEGEESKSGNHEKKPWSYPTIN